MGDFSNGAAKVQLSEQNTKENPYFFIFKRNSECHLERSREVSTL